MTTASGIITQAYRESNLIPIGQVPSDAQNSEALARLAVLVSGALGTDVGQRLVDWPVGTVGIKDGLGGWSANDWSYPASNSRLVINVQAPTTIYLPDAPDDGARMAIVDSLGQMNIYPVTINGNGRKIEAAATFVANFANQTRAWLYRADIGQWVAISDVALNNEMPYPGEFDDYFITRLAMRLNPRYGRAVDPQTVAFLEESRARLIARYRQRVVVPADFGVLPNAVQVYNSGWRNESRRFRPWMN